MTFPPNLLCLVCIQVQTFVHKQLSRIPQRCWWSVEVKTLSTTFKLQRSWELLSCAELVTFQHHNEMILELISTVFFRRLSHVWYRKMLQQTTSKGKGVAVKMCSLRWRRHYIKVRQQTADHHHFHELSCMHAWARIVYVADHNFRMMIICKVERNMRLSWKVSRQIFPLAKHKSKMLPLSILGKCTAMPDWSFKLWVWAILKLGI